MPLLIALLVLILAAKVLVFSFALSALAKTLPIPLLPKRLAVSGIATICAWAVPIEHLVGATLIEGPFAPWGGVSMVVAWAMIALPSKGIFLRASAP